MPDGTTRFSIGGKTIHHYMGCSTFANYTVLPEIAVAKVRETRPSTRSATSAAASPPASAPSSTPRRSRPAPTAIVFGLGGIGLNVIQGLRLASADMIIGVDLNNAKKAVGRTLRHDAFRQSGGSRKPTWLPHLVNLTKRGADPIGGADYTFDCTGNVKVMRQALEASHRGWGQSVIIGVAGAGAGDHRRARSNSSPAGYGRARPSAARAGAPTCRRSSTGTWTARSRSIR